MEVEEEAEGSKQVLNKEQRRVVDDAKTILWYRGIADMRTTLDISWPPKDQIRVIVYLEKDGSETDQGGHPPPDCRPRPRSPHGVLRASGPGTMKKKEHF